MTIYKKPVANLEKPREAYVHRTTGETDISIKLNLDGTGACDIATGVPFFDHMLNAFARHGQFDLAVKATGDVKVDAHHTVEDTGIVLGQAFARALQDKAGITRFADVCIPMDETLVQAAVDISGRGQAYCDLPVPTQRVGSFDTELAVEFFYAFARDAGVTLHVRARTPITLSRPRSRRPAAPCALRASSIRAWSESLQPRVRYRRYAWTRLGLRWSITTRETCRAWCAALPVRAPPRTRRIIRMRSALQKAWFCPVLARFTMRSHI